MRKILRLLSIALLAVACSPANSADTIKIAFIDSLSGRYADMGFASLKQYQAAIAYTNANGGALGLDFELVPLDDQSSVKQALSNLELAIQQGIRYVTQGNNPEVSVALAKAIDAHNRDNPARSVMYLNYGDGAPQLDNDACSFWHFRFDASLAIKAHAMVAGIPADGSVQSVYLINQDDPWGHDASREILRVLTQQRPEIRIVGDELHPPGKVKDFSGYIRRIVDSGADAIVTADRSADLVKLMSAWSKTGQGKQVFIVSNSVSQVPAAIGQRGIDRVTGVFTWHANIGSNLIDQFAEAYQKEHAENWNGLPAYVAIQMLVASTEVVRSIDPLLVAQALEGLSFLGAAGPVALREDNHQLLQPLFLARLGKVGNGRVANGSSKTAVGSKLGWNTALRKEPDEIVLDTTCEMVRPEGVKRR
ncbi:MAG: branched-chain amino acid ABC transporter substrate-binding protein [Betaproteobacteria bacterium]|nr:MAG: branched-chain amino acid ABC transporter substrate-binding protein [Betaproteobacteria bacterium]